MEYGSLLRCVNAGRGIVVQNDSNSGAIFECAELFEAFGLLKERWRPGNKFEKEVAAEPIDSLVTVVVQAFGLVPVVGDTAAREVEGIAFRIDGDLNHVGIINHGIVGRQWVGCCDHWQVGLIGKVAGELINEVGIDQWLITLDVMM